MADIKLSKEDVKNPDVLQTELRKGFVWTTQHLKIVVGATAGLLLLGGAISGKTYLDEKAENEIQGQYYKIEKALTEKQAQFDSAQAAGDLKAKSKKTEPNEKDESAKANKPTGDLGQDFGDIPTKLENLIVQAPKSKAAKMAALHLSQLYSDYQKPDDALAALQKTKQGSDFLSLLVLSQIGTVQADKNDCKAAIDNWSIVLKNKKATALHSSVRLKTALCYEALKEPAQAEKLYAQIIAEDKDSPSAKSAEKYLRTIKSLEVK